MTLGLLLAVEIVCFEESLDFSSFSTPLSSSWKHLLDILLKALSFKRPLYRVAGFRERQYCMRLIRTSHVLNVSVSIYLS
ncbi:hypothetical protein Bca4012_002160 [Brassica carinata]|uniref:Uncharacterized protein n=3 Tax=Brassica TaxID=3705 RepID=A0A0D3B5J1_BRAOL|nr:unnamed protein product [Brassica napus]CDY14489.1 BnaC03g21060D [Brassica napus]VDC89493.1 unnamed protein product [Brassica oleracea]